VKFYILVYNKLLQLIADGKTDLKQTRRRLSVMSDNTLVEGLDSVNLNAAEEESEVLTGS
jgi:hypothetical protein